MWDCPTSLCALATAAGARVDPDAMLGRSDSLTPESETKMLTSVEVRPGEAGSHGVQTDTTRAHRRTEPKEEGLGRAA